MSADLARVLLEHLDDQALADLAERLRPHLGQAGVRAGRLLTVDQAAGLASVSPRTVRRALAAGLLDGEQAAGRWRVGPDALERWRAAGAPAKPTTAPPRQPQHRPRRPTSSTAADAILGRDVA